MSPTHAGSPPVGSPSEFRTPPPGGSRHPRLGPKNAQQPCSRDCPQRLSPNGLCTEKESETRLLTNVWLLRLSEQEVPVAAASPSPRAQRRTFPAGVQSRSSRLHHSSLGDLSTLWLRLPREDVPPRRSPPGSRPRYAKSFRNFLPRRTSSASLQLTPNATRPQEKASPTTPPPCPSVLTSWGITPANQVQPWVRVLTSPLLPVSDWSSKLHSV